MKAEIFYDCISKIGIDFFTGVPDSQLKQFCEFILSKHGISERHIICANEGACTSLGAGYHLATGKIPLIYMQNSGMGNALNPIVSLLNEKVYAIPAFFVIGWRGEPTIKDEPQHIFQGQITLGLLECLEIQYFILDNQISEKELQEKMTDFKEILKLGKPVAVVVRKGAFDFQENFSYHNNYFISREAAIEKVVQYAESNSIFISTTGKASRELFEIRERHGMGHEKDFLTVGSMGHSSMIALGIALQKKDKTIWCIDGDGAILMHMGALGVIGSMKPPNFIHVLINNNAHETVGGMPTVMESVNIVGVAKSCGYKETYRVTQLAELESLLASIHFINGPILIEVMVNLESRKDLGRPKTTPLENKKMFMNYLK